jgi:AFG3 family protein
MVTEFGLSPRLGALNYAQESGYQKGYSQKTNKVIDEEIRRIVNERYEACRILIETHKEKLAE